MADAKTPRVGEEIGKMQAEPLLPIEKKLIGWSLGLGIVLLVVLMVVARLVLKVTT
jgi:Na+-driven multidrug efflux pump